MATLDLIRRVTIQMKEQGGAEVVARLQALQDAQGDVVKGAQAAQEAVGTVGRRLTSLEPVIKGLERRYVDGSKAAQDFARGLRAAQEMAAQANGDQAVIARANALTVALLESTDAVKAHRREVAETAAREAQELANVERVLRETNARRARMAEERADHELEQIHRILVAEQQATEQRARNTSQYAPSVSHVDDFRAEQERRAQEERQRQAALAARASNFGPATSHIDEFNRIRAEAEARDEALVEKALQATNARRARMAEERADHEIEQIHRVLVAEQQAADQRARNASNYQPSTSHIDEFRATQLAQQEAERQRQAMLASRASNFEPATSHIDLFNRARAQAAQEAADEEIRLQANVTRRLEEEERKRLRAAVERAEYESRIEIAEIQRVLDAEREATRYREMADPAAMAKERYEADRANVTRLVDAKAMSPEEGERAMAALQTRFENYDRDLRGSIGGALESRRQLAYQANDIISGLLMGQSPLMILTQQGGQVYQAFADAPGGAAAGVKAFGASVGTFLLSPLGGVTLALTGAAAAAGIFYMKLTEGQVTTEAALKQHVDLIGKLQTHYKGAAEAATRYRTASANVMQFNLQRDMRQMQEVMRREGEASVQNILGGKNLPFNNTNFIAQMFGPEVLGRFNTAQMRPLQDAIKALMQSVKDGNPDFVRFQDTISRIGNESPDQKLKDLVKRFNDLTDQGANAQREFRGLVDINGKLGTTFSSAAEAAQALATGMERIEALVKSGGLQGYAAQINAINRAYDAQQLGARNEAQTRNIETARQQAITQANQQQIQGPSQYRYSIADVPPHLQQLFLDAAKASNIDPNLLATTAKLESNFRPEVMSGAVKSPAGAIGTMQFMPGTAAEMNVNPYDVESSVYGAARYHAISMAKYGNDPARLLASYNAGRFSPAAKNLDFRGNAETAKYVAEGTTPRPGGEEAARTENEYHKSVAATTAALAAQREQIGLNAAEAARLQYIREKEAEAIAKGEPLTEAQIQDVNRLAEAHADLVREQAHGKFDEQMANQNRQTELQRQLLGKTAEEQAKIKAEFQAQEQARLAGYNLSKADLELARQRAAAEHQVAQSAQAIALGRELAFEREQMFRSPTEQAVNSRLRGAFGPEYANNPEAQQFADQIRLQEALKTTRDLASTALTGFVSDLRSGVPMMEALANTADKLADKIIDMALNNFVNAMFQGMFGGTGGMAPGVTNPFAGLFGGNRATGGPMDGGKFYMVGESGPEVFASKSGGHMIPNHALGGGQGGGGNVTVNVHESGNARATVTQRNGPQGPTIDVQLEDAVAGMIGAGRFDGTMRRRFGSRAMG